MLLRRAFVLLIGTAVVFACGSDESSPVDPTNDGGTTADSGPGPGPGPGDDGGTIPDGGGSDGPTTDAAGDGGAPGFVVETPQIEIASGEDIIKCFYLHVPSTTDIAVKTWKSTKTAGVGHAALHFTETDLKAPGTVSADDCGAGGSTTPSWVYSAYKSIDGWSFPSDDGAGKPVAKTVKAGQPAFVLMHLTNTTGAAIMSKVTIEGIGYATGTVTTAAEPYVTHDGDITVNGQASNVVESTTCDVPTGSKLAWLSTQSRKLSIETKVSTGGTAIFTGTDWQDPGTLVGSPPFKTFTNDKVSVECTYTNPTMTIVRNGDTVADEVCAMLGYVFPATKPRLCYNGILLP